ncbi:hypothetical protein D3C85_1324320 [compost metagenome]
MEIDRHDTGGTCRRQHIRYHFGRNRFPWCGLPLLTGISVVRHNNVDRPGRRPFGCIYHNQQLYEQLVNRMGQRLYNEDIRITDALLIVNIDLTTFEPGELDFA